MSYTYGAAYEALTTAETASLRTPSVSMTWHNATPKEAEDILQAFPDMHWSAHKAGPHQWLETPTAGSVRLTVFVAEPSPQPELTAAANALARFKGES